MKTTVFNSKTFESPKYILFCFHSDSKAPNYCIERWPRADLRLTYTVLVFIGQYLAPLIITTTLYIRIGCWLSSRSTILNRPNDPSPDSTDSMNNIISLNHKPVQSTTTHLLSIRIDQRTRRTHRILVSIVSCFGICWTPWMINTIYLEWLAYSIDNASSMAGYPIGNDSHYENATLNGDAYSANAHLKLVEMFLKVSESNRILAYSYPSLSTFYCMLHHPYFII